MKPPASFTLPRWFDLHAHVRQGALLEPLLAAHRAMGCAGLLAMPNTSPPVLKTRRADDAVGLSIEEYQGMIRAAGGEAFDPVIVPLYLSAATTPAMIDAGAKAGILKAAKYYPPHGTTNAGAAAPLDHYRQNGVLKAMAEHGIILCLHGEKHGLSGTDYFDEADNAETRFYKEDAPRLRDAYPDLRIVAEHVTTQTAVAFVRASGKNIGATVTPQHLLYTVGDLLQGLRYHMFCLPVLKFDRDRAALRDAVTAMDNTRFFAGTDSAPHTKKVTECGCAAGCFTGGIAPQLYAQAFEESGLKLEEERAQAIFRRFLCENGASFYGLNLPAETFTLTRAPQKIMPLLTKEGPILPLPLGLAKTGAAEIPWSVTG